MNQQNNLTNQSELSLRDKLYKAALFAVTTNNSKYYEKIAAEFADEATQLIETDKEIAVLRARIDELDNTCIQETDGLPAIMHIGEEHYVFKHRRIEQLQAKLDKLELTGLSLCNICYCMTYTISDEFEEQCSKCGADKGLAQENKLESER